MNAMKAEGVDFEERLDRLQDVTYPKPLEEMLDVAFATYCAQVPWANDYELSPKSVLRDMLETGCDFKSYIAQYKIARCEGILLRYLTEAYRSLDRTVPVERRTEELDDIVSWLGLVVRSVDSSLVDEWANAGMEPGAAPIKHGDEVVADRRGMTLMVRNTLFQRVRLARPRPRRRPRRPRRRLGLRREPLGTRARCVLRSTRGPAHRRRCAIRRVPRNRRI